MAAFPGGGGVGAAGHAADAIAKVCSTKYGAACMVSSAMKQPESVVVRCERHFDEAGVGSQRAGICEGDAWRVAGLL